MTVIKGQKGLGAVLAAAIGVGSLFLMGDAAADTVFDSKNTNNSAASSVSGATAYGGTGGNGGNGSGVATNTLDLTLGSGKDPYAKWYLGLAAWSVLAGSGGRDTSQSTNIPYCADYVHNSLSGPLNIGASETTSHPNMACVAITQMGSVMIHASPRDAALARAAFAKATDVDIRTIAEQEALLGAALDQGTENQGTDKCPPGKVRDDSKGKCVKPNGDFRRSDRDAYRIPSFSR